MEELRSPFQGVYNIIRFNWHFYVIAIVVILFLGTFSSAFDSLFNNLILLLIALISGSTILSLFVSYYVYDLSGLYKLNWIDQTGEEKFIVNVNAGFDETSTLLAQKFKNANLQALDFYNPNKHTEVSIKRARKAYPPYFNTKTVETFDLKLEINSVDKIFVMLAAHEIRDENERIVFFKALKKALRPGGKIYIMEHLRDWPNFIAYNIGFFHFYNKKNWTNIFNKAGLIQQQELKQTPFISIFILNKNGDTT